MSVIYHINNIYIARISCYLHLGLYIYYFTFQYNRYVDKSFLTNTDNIVGVMHVLPILTCSVKQIYIYMYVGRTVDRY